MIIIGVTGATGAGKSTFSSYLNESLGNAKIVSLDHIFDRLKTTIFSSNTDTFIRDNGEEICYLKKESTFSKFVKIKGVKEAYQVLRKYYGYYIVNKEIKQAENENIKYLIFESINLYEFIDCKKINYKILLTANREIRKSRVMQRDADLGNLLEETFECNDNEENIYKLYDFAIENIFSIDYLRANANNIANTIKDNFSLIRKK